ncbi:MAG: hypothetical protein ACTFAK_12330 [Candidatus Electronema sp. VV]
MPLKKYAAFFITAGKKSGGSQSGGHDLSRAHRALRVIAPALGN